MFDAGFSELILLFIIGLLILGPERLPRVATQIGRWVGRARRTASQLRHQLEREIALDDIRRSSQPKPKPKEPPTSTSSEGGTGNASDAAGDEPAETSTEGPGDTSTEAPSESPGGVEADAPAQKTDSGS